MIPTEAFPRLALHWGSEKRSGRREAEVCRDLLWHRLLAFHGGSERGQWVPKDLTWDEFQAMVPRESDETKLRHRYEVDHITGKHKDSFTDWMVIKHWKNHNG